MPSVVTVTRQTGCLGYRMDCMSLMTTCVGAKTLLGYIVSVMFLLGYIVGVMFLQFH